jgi:hypothetical protein
VTTAGTKVQRLEKMKTLVALSEPLIEFVADDTGVAPETVFKVMLSIGRELKRSAGMAAAAIYFNKPVEQVTLAEAYAVIEQVAAVGDDRDRTWGAWRAALRQAVFLLEPVIIPETLAGLTMESSRLLDEGHEFPGMFTPPKRGRGRPGRSVNGSDKHLMIEVIYTQTLKNVSRDEAVTLVTGKERMDAALIARKRPEPTMPRDEDQATLRRIVGELEKAWPPTASKARIAAEAQLRGEPVADFDAFRKRYLAIERALVDLKERRG